MTQLTEDCASLAWPKKNGKRHDKEKLKDRIIRRTSINLHLTVRGRKRA